MTPIETRQFAREQVSRLLRDLAFQINRTAKSCSADAVHDMRVAIRRFAQAIAVYKPCFLGKETRKIRRRLKKIMLEAGEIRNYDVALEFLAKTRLADGVDLRAKLQGRRKDSSRVLVSELRTWSERQMSLKWRETLDAPRSGDAFGDAEIHVTSRRTVRPMLKELLKRGSDAGSRKASAEDLHRLRIAAKKFRYTLELFVPVYGTSLDASLSQMKRAQTLLGDINDCETTAAMVSRHNGGNRLVSRLKKRQRKKTEEFLQYWAEDFQQGEQLRLWINRLEGPVAPSRGIKKPAARSGSAAPQRKSTAAVA